MKVRELIELLQKEDPEAVVNMMNGVGRFSPLEPEQLFWSEELFFTNWVDGAWRKDIGPRRMVFSICADW